MPKLARDYKQLGEKCRPLYEAGQSTHAIAAELRLPQPAIRRALMTVGCPVRTAAQALRLIAFGRIATDEQIAAALKSERGNAAKASAKLGISATAVHYRLKKSEALRTVRATAKGR